MQGHEFQIARTFVLTLIAAVSLVSSNPAAASKHDKELLLQSGQDVERAIFHWCDNYKSITCSSDRQCGLAGYCSNGKCNCHPDCRGISANRITDGYAINFDEGLAVICDAPTPFNENNAVCGRQGVCEYLGKYRELWKSALKQYYKSGMKIPFPDQIIEMSFCVCHPQKKWDLY